jgi:ubiquinone/menaquinone biosynthesis C-methylase UbiE
MCGRAVPASIMLSGMTDAAATARLTSFYGRLSPSLEFIQWVLEQAGIDLDDVQPRDLYERDLDCHNLGMHVMVERIADIAAEYGAPEPDATVLDLGCGLGGPGRIVADRFGCRIVGVDLLPLRVELAEALAAMTKMGDRTSYRVADATRLEFDAATLDQVWMLDVSMHIRDKAALFAEIARVLRPGGLLVMHEQTGPLPTEMRPVTRQAPYIAPSLPQLLRYVEGADLRVLTWRDSTSYVLDYFLGLRALLDAAPPAPPVAMGVERDQGAQVLDAYISTLERLGGRTGMLIARRNTFRTS